MPKIPKTDWLKMVEDNGMALCAVPENFKTPELCLIAFKQAGSLQFVPKEFFNHNKFLTEKQLKKKYTREELLTSNNAYLRKLGASYVKDI